ncbi:hypothetical protein NHH03_13215 [Stieleria sp. TO1_6]|uniref:hypothetical protein n=1 Tax=Stieleria tagensis TaxID=2956795 RepID=UPI00209ABBAD|nr:hypothetical protein [Stieleria tagensis]MCO8122701.1 hypothetical protein [Stieleria tagensis]
MNFCQHPRRLPPQPHLVAIKWLFSGILIAILGGFPAPVANPVSAADGSKFAHSDGDARYLHQIHLYDADNRRIEPDSTKPYSSVKTCGRCHDYDTISHGWHFNAFLPDTDDGREGEPWIWTDPRTGTQLPLSYRQWSQTFDPRVIGIDQWDMVKQFGGRIPGGGLGHAPDITDADATTADDDSPQPDSEPAVSRWPLSGSLEIDCLVCHGVAGSYDFNARREQIADENFAWAATAGLRIGTIDGQVSRIKDGADPDDESTQEKLPQVRYDSQRFAADGTVHIDLIRQPQNNACYQCHSNRTVADGGIQARWTHDEDVHLRAGMQCTDCHRNGIDHHIVRGFPGEDHPADQSMITLSCAGCHLGDAASEQLAGRLGSPLPQHAGLPPLHFEKLSCTACHGGPLPRDQAMGIMTSLAHSLGEKGHRSGSELPAIAGPVYAKQADGRIYPHRAVWPAYWASLVDGKLNPIDPETVYDVTRRSLRVRQDFATDLLAPKLGSTELKEVLGEDRYRSKPEEWTAEETAKIAALTQQAGEALFAEKVSAALAAIEQEQKIDQAVYVSAGWVYARGDADDTLQKIEVDDHDAIDMIRWPMAHNVRPAGWSLGIKGCTECHSESAKLFASTVTASGPGPDRGEPVMMATLQGIDADQRLAWNQLFSGRASFKYVIVASVAILLLTLLLAGGMVIGRIAR